MHTKMCHITQHTTQDISFHTNDKKGREIGARITTYEVDFVEAPQAMGYDTTPVGHYFVFLPHATRNTLTYGACQPFQYFLNTAERDNAIEKYLASARKRADKPA